MNLLSTLLEWIRWILIILCSIYIALMIGGAMVNFLITPNRSSIELIKTLFGVALWLAVPVFLLTLLLRSRGLMAAAVIPVIFFVLLIVPFLIPRSPEVDANAPRLSVMTFNLKAQSDSIVEAIRSADADVVALQELSVEGAEAVEQLEDLYPYRALHPQVEDVVGQGILSRYPIEMDTYWEYPNVPYTLGNQRVEIDFNGTPIVIYNVHPWPPLEWESGYDDESHRVVLLDIAERAFAEEMPLLLVGDFNMTDVFEEYDLLASRFTDSYREAGNSTGYTFPNYKFKPFPSLLRLDYIWHSEHFQSVQSQVWGQYGESDHSPVVTILAFRG